MSDPSKLIRNYHKFDPERQSGDEFLKILEGDKEGNEFVDEIGIEIEPGVIELPRTLHLRTGTRIIGSSKGRTIIKPTEDSFSGDSLIVFENNRKFENSTFGGTRAILPTEKEIDPRSAHLNPILKKRIHVLETLSEDGVIVKGVNKSELCQGLFSWKLRGILARKYPSGLHGNRTEHVTDALLTSSRSLSQFSAVMNVELHGRPVAELKNALVVNWAYGFDLVNVRIVSFQGTGLYIGAFKSMLNPPSRLVGGSDGVWRFEEDRANPYSMKNSVREITIEDCKRGIVIGGRIPHLKTELFNSNHGGCNNLLIDRPAIRCKEIGILIQKGYSNVIENGNIETHRINPRRKHYAYFSKNNQHIQVDYGVGVLQCHGIINTVRSTLLEQNDVNIEVGNDSLEASDSAVYFYESGINAIVVRDGARVITRDEIKSGPGALNYDKFGRKKKHQV